MTATIEKILQKQFEVIDLSYKISFIENELEWNKKYNWRYTQKIEFCDWLYDKITHDRNIRKVFIKLMPSSKKLRTFDRHSDIVEAIEFWCINYGWRDY